MASQRPYFRGTFNTKICKYLLTISSIFLLIIYIFFLRQYNNSKGSSHHLNPTTSPTNISHIFFGIATSSKTWTNKQHYIQSWWLANTTRGHLYLDKSPTEHLPWPSTYPPYRVSEDTSRYREYNKHAMPFVIRIARIIEEEFAGEHEGEVRWYVMTDDDTVVMIDNLVEVLSEYDHRKYYYIGMSSESVVSNCLNSFEMGFGGAGYALSYPLAKAVAQNMDLCIKRYPTLFGSDHILQSCIADFGVSFTQHKGFHQIDLHRDISGLLSSHPQSPLVSLHHLDAVDPIFPSMNRVDSLNHLMKAASLDQSRLLQQSICYYHIKNWTFSVSWGYSVQIYEAILPPSHLHRPLETFIPWKNGASPPYMFNTRRRSPHPCEAPHFFFFDSIEENRVMDHVVTSYVRRAPRSLRACASSGNRSADQVLRVRLLSPAKNMAPQQNGGRRECCDIVQLIGMDSLAIKLRNCMDDEIVA